MLPSRGLPGSNAWQEGVDEWGRIWRGGSAGTGGNRLAVEVQTDHAVARAYVDLLLGG